MKKERQRILKLVEEGKLTAAEAEILLSRLEEQGSPEVSDVPSVHVDWDNAQTGNTGEKSASKFKLMDFVDSAIQKIKDFDLDFNFGPSYEVNHIFQQKDVMLKHIDLDISNGDISIQPWEEHDVRIECKAKIYKVQDEKEAKAKFLQDVRMSIDGNRMLFSIQKKQMKVSIDIYVPNEQYNMIKTRTFNGHIHAQQLKAADFEAKTANGKITLSQIHAKDIELETANGHVVVTKANAEAIEVETLNGTIHVDGACQKVDLQSFNGPIACTLQDTSTHTAFLQTKTGAIDLVVQKGVEVEGELTSNIGDFSCEFADIAVVKEKNEVVQKEYHFLANKGASAKLYVEAKTTAGKIRIKEQ